MQRTVRNTTTHEVKVGNLGRMYDGSGWVNCLDSNGAVKSSEQVYVDDYYVQQAISSRVDSRIRYLADTDWYICREADVSSSYPTRVQDKRINARDEINAIEVLTVLADVEAYSEDFSL